MGVVEEGKKNTKNDDEKEKKLNQQHKLKDIESKSVKERMNEKKRATRKRMITSLIYRQS